MLHDACFLGFDVCGLSPALRRWLILISAVAHQRQAVALLTPSLRQIGFQRMPSARSHTTRASSGSSQNSQAKHSSMRSMDCGVAQIFMGWRSMAMISHVVRTMAGQTLK